MEERNWPRIWERETWTRRHKENGSKELGQEVGNWDWLGKDSGTKYWEQRRLGMLEGKSDLDSKIRTS